VVPLNIALLDKEGIVALYRHPKTGSKSSIIFKYSDAKILKVKGRTLDNVLNELKICNAQWIKIDAEGAEMLILKGAEKLLNNKDINIILQTHDELIDKEIRCYLKSKGFKVLNIDHEGLYAYR